MPRLFLLRHAEAALPAAGRMPDHTRPLTEAGRMAAARMAERVGPVDAIYTSSALRTLETAGFAAAANPAAALHVLDQLYLATAPALLECLREAGDAEALLLVGHNPGLAELAIRLGRGDADAVAAMRRGFPPAGVAVFAVSAWADLSPRTAGLERFETP